MEREEYVYTEENIHRQERGINAGHSLLVKLMGSFSCTSRAAARMRPSLRAAASAVSSTSRPRAVLIRKAPVSKTHYMWYILPT